MSDKCFFNPTAGQVGNVTIGKDPSNRKFDGFPDFFGSCIVLLLISVCVVVILIMCYTNEDSVDEQEQET